MENLWLRDVLGMYTVLRRRYSSDTIFDFFFYIFIFLLAHTRTHYGNAYKLSRLFYLFKQLSMLPPLYWRQLDFVAIFPNSKLN